MLIPIVAIICAVGLPVVAIIVLIVRLTSSTNKERMEMIKRGMIPPEKTEQTPSRLRTLRAGMGAIGGGIGGILSVFVLEFMLITSNPGYQFLIVMGTIFLCFGIAFTAYYFISKDKIDSEDNYKL